MKADDMAARRRECVLSIESAITSVFEDIERMAAEFERLWKKNVTGDGVPASADLKPLRAIADHLLTSDNHWMLGTGVVLEPGVLSDCDMYCEWRHLVGEGHPTQLDLNFNRSSDSYYNYREMPWFTRPRGSGERTVEGPYIDLYGQDAYILTFARPLNIGGEFIGIAGADVDLGQFERALASGLLTLDHDALLLNEAGRVVASNASNWLPGERAPFSTGRGAVTTTLGSLHANWRLIEYPSSTM